MSGHIPRVPNPGYNVSVYDPLSAPKLNTGFSMPTPPPLNAGPNVSPYAPSGAPNWGLQPLAQLNQSLQALVVAMQTIYAKLGGT